MGQGYTEWTGAEHGSGPAAIAGQALSRHTEPPRWRRGPTHGILDAADRTTVTQEIARYLDAPLAMRPLLSGSVTVDFAAESDRWAWLAALESPGPVLWYPGAWWHVDRWSIALGGPGRTTWRTSRRLPVEVPGMAEAPHPPAPAAYVDGAPRPDVTIPASNNGPGGGCAELVTPDLHAEGATVLELRYPPEWLISVISAEDDPTTANLMRTTVELREVLRGSYTPIS